jgi:hypothetical protein
MTETNSDGALAGALAKAQAAFPAIARDKEVTVSSERTGKSYKFKYAPLDSILNAVRAPLSSNGLALVQLLDDGDLVTMLMHESGARLAGRVTLPTVEGVQALGSAITYLRRYSIQAILGIAAEEDDDGNHASGNDATFGPRTRGAAPERPASRSGGIVQTEAHPSPLTDDGGLIGTAITEGNYDFGLRQVAPGADNPTGLRWKLPFRVKNGSKSFIVVAEDNLAEVLAPLKEQVVGQRVTVWGHWSDETIEAKGTKPTIHYRILHLERIATSDWTLPMVEAPTAELFADDLLALDAELDAAS